MPRPIRLATARSAGLVLVAAASVALLAGCTGRMPGPTDTAAPTTVPANPSETSVPAPPTETAEPPIPFEIACDALITADQLYAFNPNFGVDPGYQPQAAAIVTAVEEDAGTACGYLNQTSGDVIEIAVATPTEQAGEARRNDAALTSKPVPTYGTPPEVEGYFHVVGGSGEAQVFSGPYWIVIDSPALFEPGDAQQLVASVLQNLPAA
ncbi:iron ABC transporter ATP-binding protein [Agromyces sp. H66]|uniref:iron ABC transporter ATP-binding protein n=1 Tax=Agromyces sp. H66 TaxID=2529859 RepID=UPI0010AA66A0|nr:iron ABC transporter ATP-binding protein [Agromyces sp. H66]